jgi:two-component system chemotaxis response regulator CheB
MTPVRVLIVDDSATMRGLISAVLSNDPAIEVVGTAGDAISARAAIKALNPDVVTLDIEMPNMNGLAFLEKIMRLRPMPVIMISTLTQKGADASITALEIGAFDCVSKPTQGVPATVAFANLGQTVKAAARARVRPFTDHAAPDPAAPDRRGDRFLPNGKIIAIGSSTGGVEALLAVISGFPANCPPTVITQHMPATFTGSFAQRMNRSCAATVSQAIDGAPLVPGQIYLAPGGAAHLEIFGPVGGQMRCRLTQSDLVNGHRPSVDTLFESTARLAGSMAVGAILTGMGRDGARGLLAMRQACAATLGQDEASSIVYGMPKAAFELGGVEHQLPLQKIGPKLLALCNLENRVRA